MHTLQQPVTCELNIKNSRFLGRVEPVLSLEDGLQRLAALRQQHPGAAHVCHCLLVGGQVRMSDDGEPGGTAASPMLNVLQHKELDFVLATVVRYFGGVKLGAGGLVRAYTQAVSDALKGAVLERVRVLASATIELDFAHESLTRRMGEAQGIQMQFSYGQRVTVRLEGEQQELEHFLAALQEHTCGAVTVK